MCGGSAPQTDPAAVAQAQGAANQQTAVAQGYVNNPNITNPYGSQQVTWQDMGNGNWQPSINQTLAPAQQQMLNSQNQMGVQLGKMGVNQLGAIQNMQTPIGQQDLAGAMNQIQRSGANSNPTYQTGVASNIDPSAWAQYMANQQGKVYSPFGSSGGTSGPSRGGMTAGPSAQLSTGTQGSTGDAAAASSPATVAQAPGSLQPLMADALAANTLGGVEHPFGSAGSIAPIGQIQNSLGTTPLNIDAEYQNVVNGGGGVPGLGNIQNQINTQGVQGIPTVDAAARQHAEDMAYQAATSRLDPQWQQAQQQQQTQLTNQGLVPGGEAYDNSMRVFNQGKNDAYLQAQANAVNQGLTNQQAQFGMGLSANQAGFGNAQNMGQFANQAQMQGLNQNLNLAGLYNAGQAQNYNQQLGMGQFANTAQQQQYGQNLGFANAYQQMQNQAFNQSQTNLGAANAAQNQQFQQGLATANLGQDVLQNQFGQGMQNATLNNTVGQQQFQQGLQNANLNNAAVAQQIQTYLTGRQLPLNELNAFRTGSQVQTPQFQQFAGAGQMTTPNMGQIAANNQNAQVASQNSYNSGLASLLGSGMMAYGLYAASDIRLKSNIKRIGTHPFGIGIYEYDIFGNRTKGVMAHELERVMPQAVRIGGGGYKMVNYAIIGGVNA